MIGRSNENNIEIFLDQHFAIVAILARLLFISWRVANQLGGFIEHDLIDIAQTHDFDG